ncbi:MAG: hypothetical protein HY360_19510 [Verrucomicrobia bacterium]|nr:hypothetical protein [Verrucomicrobiota bacterium]
MTSIAIWFKYRDQIPKGGTVIPFSNRELLESNCWISWKSFLDRKLKDFRPHPSKLSTQLMELVKPLLPEDEYQHKTYESCFILGTLVWNLPFFPEDQQAAFVKRILATAPPERRNSAREAVRTLIERRRTLFAKDRRMIADFHLTESGTDFNLRVISILDSSKCWPLIGEEQIPKGP